MIYRHCSFPYCKFNNKSACHAPQEYYNICEYGRLKRAEQESQLSNLQELFSGNGGASCPYCGGRIK